MPVSDSIEVWRRIPGFVGASSSPTGRIRGTSGKLLKLRKNKAGYYQICLSYGKSGERRQKTKLVHRLVALVFHGECPRGLEVNHEDGNKLDNRADNLEYVTRPYNHLHAYRIGLQISCKGEQHGHHKLTGEIVRLCRRLVGQGKTCTSLAYRFGVSVSVMWEAVVRKTWKHVK